MINLSDLKPETQRAMAIAVPAAVLLFAACLTLPKASSWWSINQQTAARQRQCEAIIQENLAETSRQEKQRPAACPQTKGEQLAFLKDLGRVIGSSHVRLVSYRPPATGNATSAAGTNTPGEGSVKPIATEVTVAGQYRELVTLFRSLSGTQRLFTVDSVQIHKDTYPRLSATFRLVRYVIPAPTQMAGSLAPTSAGS